MLPSNDNLNSVLETCTRKDSLSFAAAFGAKSGEGGDWALLQQLFNFHFRPKTTLEPFGPMAKFGEKRSMIPDDLTDEQLDELSSTLEDINDPEYRARVGDVLWLRRHDPSAARVAVNAYIDSGFRLEDLEHWTASVERYERAVRLARQIEPKGDLPKKALAHIELRVRHYDGNDPRYFTLRSLKLLEEFRFGDFRALSEIAGRMAAKAKAERDFNRAKNHFDIQARLLQRAGDLDAAEFARIAYAKCFVDEAEARENDGSYMIARVSWEAAIKAFRDRASLRPLIPDLQKRLAAAGVKTLEEMKSHGVEIDVSGDAEIARKAIMGLPLEDAFFQFLILEHFPFR